MLFLIIFMSESALYTPHNSKHLQRPILGNRDRCSQHGICHVASLALEGILLLARVRNTPGIAAYTASMAYPMPNTISILVNLVRRLLSTGAPCPLQILRTLVIDLLWLLLRCSTSNIFPDIGDINELAPGYLCAFPPLSNRRGHALVLDLRVNHGRSMGEGALHKVALVESCSQEDCINT